MNLGGVDYQVLGSRIVSVTQIFLRDSNPHKTIEGHGGTHLYIGRKSDEPDAPDKFFDMVGHNSGDETPNAILNLHDLSDRFTDELVFFPIYVYDGQRGGREEERFYVKSESEIWGELRSNLDPEVHQFSVVKLKDPNGQMFYYFKILSDTYAEEFTVGDLGADPELEKLIPDTETQVLQTVRLTQGRFRKAVMKCFENRCVITGIEYTQVLDAAHIKPWKISSPAERLDPHNGLLMIGTCHKMFDLGLIMVDEHGCLQVSPFVPALELGKINMYAGTKLMIPEFAAREPFLKWHRENIFLRS